MYEYDWLPLIEAYKEQSIGCIETESYSTSSLLDGILDRERQSTGSRGSLNPQAQEGG